MKINFLSIFALIFVLTFSSYSAEPLTGKGNKCLLFGFNGLSDLSVNNSHLAVQYQFADKMGIWADVNFNSGKIKPTEQGEEYSTNQYGFTIGYIYYAFQKGSVAMYLSPQIGYSGSSTETAADRTDKITTDVSDITAAVSVGVEWWAFENISFGVSTHFGFESSKTTNKSKISPQETEATNSFFGIISKDAGKISIAFYF